MAVRIRYDSKLKAVSQELRRNMTKQEKHLWYDFLRTYPAQFRRQKQFGPFIVDFYCAAANLVVEVDGAPHFTDQGKAYDQERTWYLESLGLIVIRFTNSNIEERFDEVCGEIDRVVHVRLCDRETGD